MNLLTERIGSLREVLAGSANPPPITVFDGLTNREMEVLRFIVRGKSNQKIAEELELSKNTVIRHVNKILSKTNTGNRVEARAYATKKGFS